MRRLYALLILLGSSLWGAAQFPAPYCAEAFGSGKEPITKVTFAGIVNSSSAATSGALAHENFLSVTGGAVQQGGTYQISCEGNSDGSYTNYYSVFFDWNNDGDFLDDKEIVTIGTILNSNGIDGKKCSTNVVVPIGATLGNIRMRVSKKFSSSPTPCNTLGYGQAEDYVIVVSAIAACSGTPTAGTAAAPTEACNNSNVSLTLTGATFASGIGVQWQSSPLGANTFTDIPNAIAANVSVFQSAASDYRCVVTCTNGGASANSNVVSVTTKTTGCGPVNDEACGAIALTLNGPQECANTATATSVGDPVLACSPPNNTIWYKYTATTTGRIAALFTPPAGAGADTLRGWLGVFVASGNCPSLTLADSTGIVTGFTCGGFGAAGRTQDSVIMNVTAGKTYYLMIDGNSGDVGLFCLQLVNVVPTPCAPNIAPANLATAVVSVADGIPLSWTAVPNATYDVYFGTVNPPPYLGTLTTGASTVQITGTLYNTVYYWYVVPVTTTGGPAMGCTTNITSFTSEPVPANCLPLYSADNCDLGDAILNVKLAGEAGGLPINNTSTCAAATGGYEDFTSSGGSPFLARGTSYAGSITMEDASDYVTIWIDYDDDGFFEDNERVISNMKSAGSGTVTPFTIYIPTTATPGSHRMRLRTIYTSTAPTLLTDPCSTYNYGETEDYTVLIQTDPAAPFMVSAGTSNACLVGAKTTIDAGSNNNTVFVPILDATGKVIAAVNANGTNLGNVAIGEYVNTSAVRTSGNSIKYLNRNIVITPQKQPVDVPVTVRLYFTAAELAALMAVDPSVTGAASLNVTKTSQACAAAASTGAVFTQTANGTFGNDYFVEISIPSFSSFYLHGGSTALPVNYATLNGIRNGKQVDLSWVTTTEINNKSFEIQRSVDGRAFTSMGAINSKAVGGNSTQPITYSFADIQPLATTNYYRLKQTDMDGKATYSNTVLVKGLKPSVFTLNTLYPNPAKERITAALQSPFAGNVTFVISDMAGKMIKRQVSNIAVGDNIVAMDIAALPAGSYLLKALCTDGCETAVTKFTKQ